MVSTEELVSIIVPVYNRETILKNCVDSILQQTFKNIQLILVDDGSSDNSFFVCKTFVEKDPRVIAIHQDNGGPASARNTGLDKADGKYIMFIDSDDCIHPRCIEFMYKAICQFRTNIAMCEFEECDHSFKLCPITNTVLLDSSTVLKNGLNAKEQTLYCWAKLWALEAIRDIRYKPFSFCEDALFTIEALLNCQGSIAYVKGFPLYYYLRKNDSITKNLSNKNLMDSLEIVETILKMIKTSSCLIYKSVINYSVSAAFFAYLQAGDDSKGKEVKSRALKIILKYRNIVLFNISSSFKAKGACLISYFSIRAVEMLYWLIHERRMII